jgi:excisionase family DNA binding protein
MSDALSLPDHLERVGHALTARELGRILSVSPITLYKLAKAGRIPSFRIGSAVRFCPKSVADWLRKF